MSSTIPLLDTHVHLWPGTATSPHHHAWMTQGFPLAKRHGMIEFAHATAHAAIQPSGLIYVETDRYLPSLEPAITDEDDLDAQKEKLIRWAKEPLAELSFLRRLIYRQPLEGDGFTSADSPRVLGLVLWAPFHLPNHLWRLYQHAAVDALSSEIFDEKVVGFRYLLQGKSLDHVKKIIESVHFLENMQLVGTRTFDIGVDCHRDGVEALEAVTGIAERYERTTFILSAYSPPYSSTTQVSSHYQALGT
jgi:L-rhamnono-1,4-lactonase